MPAFEVITFMQDYISTYQFESDLPSKKTTELQSLMSTTRNRKFVIIWAHHLLATSKRKDIIKWSEELDLAGISKPGSVTPILNIDIKEDRSYHQQLSGNHYSARP